MMRSEEEMNRHLELAVQTLSASWFPANPQVLGNIREELHAGTYNDDRELFIRDIKQDPSLFIYTLRRLQEMLGLSLRDPLELVRKAELEQLRQIINEDDECLTGHDFYNMSYVQALRLQQSVIAAGTAELLANQVQIPNGVAYSCALFRQLGLSLIAFNYPHVYQKALTGLKPGRTLDRSLGTTLGFSPTMLGVAIARRFGISSLVRAGMGDKSVLDGVESGDSFVQITETLTKLCEVGEALARAGDGHYPTAEADKEFAEREIQAALGTDGLERIRNHIQDVCSAYVGAAPDLFKLPAEFSQPGLGAQQKRIESAEEPQQITHRNPYMRACPEPIRRRLEALYEHLRTKHITRETLRELVKGIIPDAGFPRGCIYLVEPESMALTPRLTVGDDSLKRYSEVHYMSPLAALDPVATAYRCRTPIIEMNTALGPDINSYIAGQIGSMQKIGVLYLELDPARSEDQHGEPSKVFKALAQALADCLNVV